MIINKENKSSPLVSVVVPAYFVDKYIERCVSSICAQTYNNLEIIVVDDGSTDNSGFIIDQAVLTDTRITVVHKVNGGLSDARNIGIKFASGEYIVFCDSDDWIEADTIENALSGIEHHSADMVVWGFSADNISAEETLISTVDYKAFGMCEEKDYLMLETAPFCAMRGYAWNKLYKLKIIDDNDLRFPRGISLVEDTVFNADYFAHCKKVLFMDYIGTHYMQRNRDTLGSRYYADYFALRDMNTNANLKILCSFGAPKEYQDLFKANADYIALQGYIRMIAKCNKFVFKQKKRKIVCLLNNQKTKEIINSYHPSNIKNLIYSYLIKYRMTSILLQLESNR